MNQFKLGPRLCCTLVAVGCSDGSKQTPICQTDACCIPVSVVPERLRAYLVDDALRFDVLAKQSSAPVPNATYWAFNAQIAGEKFAQPSCTTSSWDFDTVAAVDTCAATVVTPVGCGDRITVEVRLSSSTYDGTGANVCTGAGFGPSVTLDVLVECPVCPQQPRLGMACDYPRGGSCPAMAYNQWRGLDETVQCHCDMLAADGSGTWACPLF